jgi:hypothetical protein
MGRSSQSAVRQKPNPTVLSFTSQPLSDAGGSCSARNGLHKLRGVRRFDVRLPGLPHAHCLPLELPFGASSVENKSRVCVPVAEASRVTSPPLPHLDATATTTPPPPCPPTTPRRAVLALQTDGTPGHAAPVRYPCLAKHRAGERVSLSVHI